ncbi:hypothetical protein ZWY2020_027276 [Hordeum vulgare]|nr:hypothetical protein ZWY2020_027276 [Hordeum vulgare]
MQKEKLVPSSFHSFLPRHTGWSKGGARFSRGQPRPPAGTAPPAPASARHCSPPSAALASLARPRRLGRDQGCRAGAPPQRLFVKAETASSLADLLPTHLPLVLKICRIFQGHAKWRYMGPPNLKEMDVMFENAHVTGETASIPGEISSSSDDDAIAEVKESVSQIHGACISSTELHSSTSLVIVPNDLQLVKLSCVPHRPGMSKVCHPRK